MSTIPGLTDIAGLGAVLLDHLPELAAECISDHAMDALCDLEARTLRALAAAPAATAKDLALKAGVLVARLVDDSAEIEIPDGEAALLRSLLHDLTVLASAGENSVSADEQGTTTLAKPGESRCSPA